MKLIETNLWEEVDREKNDLDSVSVLTHGSEQKIWWKCSSGHNWQASIYNRVRLGRGCPYCAGKKASVGHSVFDVPALVLDWDFQKNKIDPKSVTPGSGMKVWWRCKVGHSWMAAIYARKHNGCPVCANKTVDTGSLESFHPDVAKEMVVVKTGFRPNSVRPQSNKRAVWKCRTCGHEWESQINNRVNGGRCPRCFMKGMSRLGLRFYCEIKAFFSDAEIEKRMGKYRCDVVVPSLKTIVEIDGRRWHRNEVRDREKTIFLEGKGYQVIRARGRPLEMLGKNDVLFDELSDVGILDGVRKTIGALLGGDVSEYHSFQNDTEYRRMLRGFTIIPGTGMIEKKPELMREWDPNNPEDPKRLRYGSEHKVGWVCSKGHRWTDSPYNRVVTGSGCHICSGRKVGYGNSFSSMFPEMAGEWNYKKNTARPDALVGGSNKRIWWICKKGHEWATSIQNRAKGDGCPYCNCKRPTPEYNFAAMNPHLLSEWDYAKNQKQPSDYLPYSNKKVWWKCKTCRHEWLSCVSRRTEGHGCVVCGKTICVQSKLKNKLMKLGL